MANKRPSRGQVEAPPTEDFPAPTTLPPQPAEGGSYIVTGTGELEARTDAQAAAEQSTSGVQAGENKEPI